MTGLSRIERCVAAMRLAEQRLDATRWIRRAGVTALVCAAVSAAGWLSVDGAAMAAPAHGEQSRSAATNVSPDSDATSDREREIRAIENALDRYSIAFSTLNARAAVAVWPTADEKALARAFESLDDQNVSFHDCQIATTGVRAEVACSGTARYEPKVGRRGRRPEPHRWTFSLHKANDGWLIDRVETRAAPWHDQ
jgi:hypothetical protein